MLALLQNEPAKTAFSTFMDEKDVEVKTTMDPGKNLLVLEFKKMKN